MKDLSTVAKGAQITFIGFLASKLFAYLYSVLLARTLGPNDFGVFSLAGMIFGLVVAFASLGLPNGISRYVAFYGSRKEDAKVKGTLVGGLSLTLISSVAFAVLLFLTSDYLGVAVYGLPDLAWLLKIFALMVPFAVIESSLVIALLGLKKVVYRTYVRNFVENISKILFYAFFILLGFRLTGAAAGLFLSYAVSLLVALYFLEKKSFPFLRTKLKPEYNFRELFNFSWPLLGVSLFSSLLVTIDSLMLGFFVNASAVGIYKVAQTLAGLQFIAYESLGVLVLPIVTGYFAVKDRKNMSFFFKAVTRWTFSLSLPILVFLMVFSRPLIEHFYGPEYASGYLALSIISVGFFIIVSVGHTQSIIRAIGKPKLELLNMIIMGVADILLNLWLIPVFEQVGQQTGFGSGYGVVGAAIATAASYAMLNIISLWQVYFYAGIHPYKATYVKPVIASIITAAVAFVASQYIALNSLIEVALAGIVLMAFYSLVFLLIRGFEKEDVEIMRLIEVKIGFKLPLIRGLIKRFL